MVMDRGRFDARLSRRTLVAGSAAILATGGVVHGAAQDATPIPEGNLDAFRALTRQVLGMEDISEDVLQVSWGALNADDDRASALQAMLEEGGEIDMGNLSDEQQAVVDGILGIWYAGEINDEPIEGRERIFAQLLAFQALPYTTLPAVCKNWGYWAEDLGLPDRDEA